MAPFTWSRWNLTNFLSYHNNPTDFLFVVFLSLFYDSFCFVFFYLFLHYHNFLLFSPLVWLWASGFLSWLEAFWGFFKTPIDSNRLNIDIGGEIYTCKKKRIKWNKNKETSKFGPSRSSNRFLFITIRIAPARRTVKRKTTNKQREITLIFKEINRRTTRIPTKFPQKKIII
jgi:hypothetical protein